MFEFQFLTRRLASRRAGRARGRAGIGCDRADGSRRSLRRGAFLESRATAGVDAILGSELTFEDGARIVLLVEDEDGYAHLCELISRAQMRGRKGDARLRLEDFEGRSERLDRAVRRRSRSELVRFAQRIAAYKRDLRRTILSRAPAASHAARDAAQRAARRARARMRRAVCRDQWRRVRRKGRRARRRRAGLRA